MILMNFNDFSEECLQSTFTEIFPLNREINVKNIVLLTFKAIKIEIWLYKV